MTRRFVHYDEDRWAVWSTVVDDWLVTDCSEEEVIEWYADQRRQEAVEEAQNRIEEIRTEI